MVTLIVVRWRNRRDQNDVSSLISTIFGAVSPEQNHILHHIAREAIQDERDLIRSLLLHTDHQTLPSRFIARFGPDEIEWLEVDGLYFATDRSEGSVSPQVADGYEPHVARILQQILARGDIFVDVGANIGVHAIAAARIVGPHGQVIAVEPNSENCRLLLLAADRNEFLNITLIPSVLSDEGEWTWFGSHIGSNGGVLPNDAEAIASGFGSVVPVRKLDEVAPDNTTLIKIDVEGAEISVLRSGLQTLERDRPSIVMEFSCEMIQRVSGVQPLEALEWIEHLGYEISLISKEDGELSRTSPQKLIDEWESPHAIEDVLLTPIS